MLDRAMIAALMSVRSYCSLLLGLLLASLTWMNMAHATFGIGGATCTAQSKTAGTSLACTVATQNLDAGNVAVLWFAGDNVLTADAATNLLTSVTDSAGNTWTVQQCWTNAQGAAAAGATACVATSVLNSTLASGSGTITANFSSITAKAMVVREFTIGAGRSIALVGTPQTLSNDNADPGSMSISGLQSGEHLFVRSTALERAAGGTWTVTAGYTSSNCNGTTGAGGASNMNICGEFRILTGTSGTSDPTGTNVDNASVFIAFDEVPKTIIGDGANPADAAIAPGAAITDLDAFTLATSTGTDSITSLTVTLTGASSFESLSEVRITSNDNATTYFSAVTNPGSNTVSFSGGTAIPVTTTPTTFKVRIIPKSHAAMPAPPGASYPVGGTVTAFTGANAPFGTDSASATVTVDNLSPGNVTAASCTAGNTTVDLSWTNPTDSDFNSAIILRSTAAVTDTPVEGTTYSAGDPIGSSTVACVTSSTSCTNTGLTNGTAYHYKIFARDTNVNYSATGVVPSGSPCTPVAVTRFDVVQPGADALTGRIFTKIAGQDISVDIVALDASNAIVTGFTGTVAVELVDNSSGGACTGLTVIKTLANQSFIAGDNGRHELSSGQFEANAYRNLKFRIKYPAASPTITSCSTDAFANRPLQFVSVQVRDANRTTAGTTNTLNNTSNPGTGVVHNAGRPFRIDATAQNGAGTPATTTLYSPDAGQPVAVLTQCGVAAVCPGSPGTLTTGTWSAASGVITTTTASYNDAGAFDMTLQDQTFASVDDGDGTSTSVRYIPSASALTVGRFVPDYFSLEAGSSITPRSDIGACSGSSFTYMSERMDLVFTLKAREAGGAVTANYAGATLGALVLNSSGSYNFGAIDSAAPTPLSSRLGLTLISGVTATWSAGSASVTAPISLERAAAPDGPYASLKLGIAPSDPDAVTLQSAALNLDADNSGSAERAQVGGTTAVRFGQLFIPNTYGSEKLDLTLPVYARYWNGTAFALNTADGCTSIGMSSVALGNYTGSLDNSKLPIGKVSISGAMSSGQASFTIAKPSPAGTGSVDLAVNLGTTSSFNLCGSLTTPSPASTTGANLEYLRGQWCTGAYDKDPIGRMTLGVSRNRFIYNRENY